MESNRDEAERCIEIAAQALRDSKMEKAEKFLNKAEQLYPSQKAKGDHFVALWTLTVGGVCEKWANVTVL